MAYNSLGQWRLREFPKSIVVNNIPIKVVDSFKLLGVTIDKKLNFVNYASILKNSVIKKIVQHQETLLFVV